MKTIRSLAAVALMAGAFAAHAGVRQVELSVPSMDCDTCPITIRVALMKVPGVKKAVVSYARRNAVVTFDDKATTVAALTKATEQAGYPSFQKD
ncbi:mercury resistance system periplasmic binding protein MerP [Ramlibacter sp. PS4R-6]|uniref:mercury resistance system periplasmic binding protein MerP n=1 Tax=Ramlibacter sp. PS4R-6 TaxID=3133438 RepID=UPI00309F65BE